MARLALLFPPLTPTFDLNTEFIPCQLLQAKHLFKAGPGL